MLLMPIVVTDKGDALIWTQKGPGSPEATEFSEIIFPLRHAGLCGGRCNKKMGRDSRHFRITCLGGDLTIKKGLRNIPIKVTRYHELRLHFKEYNVGTLNYITNIQAVH